MLRSKSILLIAPLALALCFGTVAPRVSAQPVQTNPGNPVQTNPSSPVQTNPGNPVQTNPSVCPAGSKCLANPLKFNSIEELLAGVLKAVVRIGGIILTLAIIWVGFKFVAARGNEEKIREARTALMWIVIGGLILLGAQAIAEVVKSTVGTFTA